MHDIIYNYNAHEYRSKIDPFVKKHNKLYDTILVGTCPFCKKGKVSEVPLVFVYAFEPQIYAYRCHSCSENILVLKNFLGDFFSEVYRFNENSDFSNSGLWSPAIKVLRDSFSQKYIKNNYSLKYDDAEFMNTYHLFYNYFRLPLKPKIPWYKKLIRFQ